MRTIHPNKYFIFFSSYAAVVRLLFPGQNSFTFEYDYLCNQTVMENGTLVKVDCKPEDRYLPFYVPNRPEETTFECVTNHTDENASLINL